MGGRKQPKLKEASVDEKAGSAKELRITPTQVVTKDKVLQNPKLMSLVYLVSRLGPIHERTLHMIVSEVQQKGFDLGYQFFKVGQDPYSPALKNDVVALLYVGLLEAEPRYKKLVVSSSGKEALEKVGTPKGLQDVVESSIQELKAKSSMMDARIDVEIRRGVGAPNRRSSRLPLGL
ncbi:hypothetical protein ASAC_0887 [Acidilobus saccharovorans 345-15]|uniref:Uncharacterized protein n=1 Tax=Acidilobus saccharovorans (strain DSM 16705 / JCM 18335 / VKM B-2471 / 345-15) TaxID=666510 RepID=D9Q1V5_ACIS3|nr:hypothetical protein [Acidilobus saccharovorans]ADL19293.1 hypothetical protein ASAC_0887 [Acidilobus saccharovorans 345-15]